MTDTFTFEIHYRLKSGTIWYHHSTHDGEVEAREEFRSCRDQYASNLKWRLRRVELLESWP